MRLGARFQLVNEGADGELAFEGAKGRLRRSAARDPARGKTASPGRGGNHALFKELLDRRHYLGYRVPLGASLRYLVRSERASGQVLACLLWSAPAWKEPEEEAGPRCE